MGLRQDMATATTGRRIGAIGGVRLAAGSTF